MRYILLLVLLGCGGLKEAMMAQQQEAQYQAIGYFEDPRTGICFAHQHHGLATVDCKMVPDSLLDRRR